MNDIMFASEGARKRKYVSTRSNASFFAFFKSITLAYGFRKLQLFTYKYIFTYLTHKQIHIGITKLSSEEAKTMKKKKKH